MPPGDADWTLRQCGRRSLIRVRAKPALGSAPPSAVPPPLAMPASAAPAPAPAPKKDGLLAPPDAPAMEQTPSGTVIVPEPHEKIFLFVPNLIGYARVVLALGSLVFMGNHPKYCTVLYCISCLLDAFDGMAARALGQSTKFGAVLDMITDRCVTCYFFSTASRHTDLCLSRCTTSCLLCFLTAEYPDYKILFQLLIALDFSSHYIHMFASISAGSSSHKKVSKETSKWLWYYYHNTNVLFIVCAANELFFVALYLMKFYTTPLGLQPAYILAPAFSFDIQTSSLWVAEAVSGEHGKWAAHLVHAVTQLSWPQVLAAATLPIWAFKQVINVIQMNKAASALAHSDRIARYEARLAAPTPKS